MPMQKGDVFMTLADIKLLKKLTGYTPKINFKQGVKNFINWYLDYYKKQIYYDKNNLIYNCITIILTKPTVIIAINPTTNGL